MKNEENNALHVFKQSIEHFELKKKSNQTEGCQSHIRKRHNFLHFLRVCMEQMKRKKSKECATVCTQRKKEKVKQYT
jgi:hypothetical protein